MTQVQPSSDSFSFDLKLQDGQVESTTNHSAAFLSSGKLVAPHRTLWCRSGWWNAKVYSLAPPSLTIDASPTRRSSSVSKESKKAKPKDASPLYSVRVYNWGRTISIFSGNATMGSEKGDVADYESRPIMDVKVEKAFSTTSTITHCDTQKNVQMYRALAGSGVEPDKLMSKRRTFDDFDGNKYKWSTNCNGHELKCTRVSDGALVASFKDQKFSIDIWGELTLHQAVSEITFYVLLATFTTCYEVERQRD